MKKVLGCIRRACKGFDLIQPDDHIAVGVSGGKDSILLLYAMSLYKYFSPIPFTFCGVHLDMGFESMNNSMLIEYAKRQNIDLHVVNTEIADVVFNIRNEKNPCSLCAKMRRGALNDHAKQLGCNKVALGHNMDDAIETFFLSMFYEGRLYTLSPKSYLDRTDITLIRPMLYLPEKHIINTVLKLDLPIIHNPCPADGKTKRQEIKQLVSNLAKQFPGVKDKILHAFQNTEKYSMWDKL